MTAPDTKSLVSAEATHVAVASASEDINNANYLVIIFLMYLSVANDFGNMVSCDLKRALKAHNAWLRQVVLFGIILFTRVSPSQGLTLLSIGQSLGLYVLVIMSTKSSVATFVPAMLCALVYLSIASDRKPGSQRTEERLRVVRDVAKYGAVALIVLGFVMYAFKQRADFGAKFSLTEFLFSAKGCARKT